MLFSYSPGTWEFFLTEVQGLPAQPRLIAASEVSSKWDNAEG